MPFSSRFDPSEGRKYSFMDNEDSPDHRDLTKRLTKTLYYGRPPSLNCPSLPLTELAVEFFQEAAPREFGRIDTYLAASVARSSTLSPCSMMLGMLYIERLRHCNPEYLKKVSSSDLFLVSMMMSSKFLYDEGVDEEVFNDEWTEAGQIDIADLNVLERDFLNAIDWHLFVKPEDFRTVLNRVERRIALQAGSKRGWFTYTDMYVLSQNLQLTQMWNEFSLELTKMILVAAVAYVANVITILSSVVVVTSVSSRLVSLGPLSILPVTPVASVLPTAPVFLSPEISLEKNTEPLPANTDDLVVPDELTSYLQERALPNGSIPPKGLDQLNPVNNETLLSFQPRQTQNVDAKGDSADSNVVEDGMGIKENISKGKTWKSYLPPLWTIISLKESIINLAFSVQDRYSENAWISESEDRPACSVISCHNDSAGHYWTTSSRLGNHNHMTISSTNGCCKMCSKKPTCPNQLVEPMICVGAGMCSVDCCGYRNKNPNEAYLERIHHLYSDVSWQFATAPMTRFT